MTKPTQQQLSDFVQREVHYCVSSLVSDLAKVYGENVPGLNDTTEEAFELCTPGSDWEEAATQEGWIEDDSGMIVHKDCLTTGSTDEYANWQECCEGEEIEPYQWEVYEHWIVSDWFAARLREHGERIGECGGLTIWGRTTTGQAIAMDPIIETIWTELHASDPVTA